MKRICMISTCILLLIFFPITATGKRYKVATVAWIGWSPLHVAQENGYWRELGLDVEVIVYDDPIVIQAIKEKIDPFMD